MAHYYEVLGLIPVISAPTVYSLENLPFLNRLVSKINLSCVSRKKWGLNKQSLLKKTQIISSCEPDENCAGDCSAQVDEDPKETQDLSSLLEADAAAAPQDLNHFAGLKYLKVSRIGEKKIGSSRD